MKAIAFAIILASFHLVPKSEFEAISENGQAIAAFMYTVCFIGFVISIIIEK